MEFLKHIQPLDTGGGNDNIDIYCTKFAQTREALLAKQKF